MHRIVCVQGDTDSALVHSFCSIIRISIVSQNIQRTHQIELVCYNYKHETLIVATFVVANEDLETARQANLNHVPRPTPLHPLQRIG